MLESSYNTMPITLEYDKQLKILIAKVTGHLTIADYNLAVNEIIESKEYPVDVNTIWDLRDMHFDNIDIEFEKQLIELRKQINHQRGSAKLAIVSSASLVEPLVKLYTILSKDLKQVTRRFNTMNEAISWLSSPA